MLPFFLPRIQPWVPLSVSGFSSLNAGVFSRIIFCPFEIYFFLSLLLVSLQCFFFFRLFVSGFPFLLLSCFVFCPLTTVVFSSQLLGHFCLPFSLGKESEMKVLTPSQKYLLFRRRSWGIEVSPCIQAVWQFCKTLSPSKISRGEGHLTFHSGSMWKKILINKFPLRWKAFSAIPADKA